VRSLSLRAKFLLILALGALLPLAIVGWWLNGTAARSGRALLHDQMVAAVWGLAAEANEGWAARSGELQLLANNTVVQAMLSAAAAPMARADSQYLQQLSGSFSTAIPSVRYVDAHGDLRWAFDASVNALSVRRAGEPRVGETRAEADAASASTSASPESAEDRALFSIDIPVKAESGRVLGSLRARVRLSTVLRTDSAGRAALGALEVRDTLGAIVFPAGATSSLSDSVTQGTWDIITQPLENAPLRISLARPVAPFVQPFERDARVGLSVLMGVALAALFVSAMLTGRVTRQIERMATVAEAVAGGDLTGRVDVVGSDEVGRLASSFNAMTESLRATLAELSQQRALAAVGEFAASLSHEVRNALTAVRIDLQHATRQLPPEHAVTPLIRRTLDTVCRLDATVTGALRVARSGQTPLVPVDLHAILRRAMASAEPSFATSAATLTPLHAERANVALLGDASALEQLFLNLFLNAAQALPVGGCARVDVLEEHGAVVVQITDDGPGMDRTVLRASPLTRLSTKPEGTGLGLPIARRIAEAHGGSLTLANVATGGLQVRVTLPRS
jgi:signal transduction histidine kinase